eukprot:scaffold11872_cov53-Attheya_sp.AAC.2
MASEARMPSSSSAVRSPGRRLSKIRRRLRRLCCSNAHEEYSSSSFCVVVVSKFHVYPVDGSYRAQTLRASQAPDSPSNVLATFAFMRDRTDGVTEPDPPEENLHLRPVLVLLLWAVIVRTVRPRDD